MPVVTVMEPTNYDNKPQTLCLVSQPLRQFRHGSVTSRFSQGPAASPASCAEAVVSPSDSGVAVGEHVGWTCPPGMPVTPAHARLQLSHFPGARGRRSRAPLAPLRLALGPRKSPLTVAVAAEPQRRAAPGTTAHLGTSQGCLNTRGFGAALCGQ